VGSRPGSCLAQQVTCYKQLRASAADASLRAFIAKGVNTARALQAMAAAKSGKPKPALGLLRFKAIPGGSYALSPRYLQHLQYSAVHR
jgi:hypothetical protein